MITGHDHLQLVPVQGIGLQTLHRRQSQKAAVHGALQDPLLDLVIEVSGDHLELDVGIPLAEALQDRGQPVNGHAGDSGHLHKARVHPLQAGGGLDQRVMGRAQRLDLGQQRPSVRRQHHAAPVPAQQRHAQLILQRLHRVADAGLGKVQRLRRLGKIAALGRFQKDLVFGNAHAATSFLSPLYHTFSHSCKYNYAFYKYDSVCYDNDS